MFIIRYCLILLTIIAVSSHPAMAAKNPRTDGGPNSKQRQFDQKRAAGKAQVLGWLFKFMNQYRGKYDFGRVVRLGDAKVFSKVINRNNLIVGFHKNLGTFGKFYEPGARLGGVATMLPSGMKPSSLLAIDDPSGKGPNATIWHETIHAIVFHKKIFEWPCMGSTESQRCGRDEAYAWLQEARVRWFERLIKFEQIYKKAKAGDAQAKSVVKRMWKIVEKQWKEESLDGPFTFVDDSGNCGGGQGASYTISRKCVEELDKVMGIKINLADIKSLYPPLDTTVGAKGGWIRVDPPQVHNSAKSGTVFNLKENTIHCIAGPRWRQKQGKRIMVKFSPPPKRLRNGDRVTLTLSMQQDPDSPSFSAKWFVSPKDYKINKTKGVNNYRNGPGFNSRWTFTVKGYEPLKTYIRLGVVGNSTNCGLKWTYIPAGQSGS